MPKYWCVVKLSKSVSQIFIAFPISMNWWYFNPLRHAVAKRLDKANVYVDSKAKIMSGHGAGHRRPRCKLDAITTDSAGKLYAFIETMYMRLDTLRDGIHPFPIGRAWKEVSGRVDAVFSNGDRIYIIQGDQIYIYKAAVHYTLIEGYPKPLKEELGIEGPVDAAFVCDKHVVHVIQGQKMFDIDLDATPRAVKAETPLPFPKIDAATCHTDGVKVFVGGEFYLYQSPKLLATSRIFPEPHKMSSEMFSCEE